MDTKRPAATNREIFEGSDPELIADTLEIIDVMMKLEPDERRDLIAYARKHKTKQ